MTGICRCRLNTPSGRGARSSVPNALPCHLPPGLLGLGSDELPWQLAVGSWQLAVGSWQLA
ncbi:MAG: hypothetical protein EOR30_34490, partial [Mesorhizobium sp.]